jgi:hypothetical protein
MLQATSLAVKIAPLFAENGASLEYQTSQNHSNPQDHFEGNDMAYALGTSRAFNRGEHSANERTATPDCADWLRDFFRNTSAKVIANDAGVNLRAAESVKMGRNGLHMNHLVNMCRSNPDFRAAFFQFCGGTLEGEPEMVAALSRAINAVVRAKP